MLRGAPGTPFFGTTALQQAIALQPTFAIVWIGNNDALAAATPAWSSTT